MTLFDTKIALKQEDEFLLGKRSRAVAVILRSKEERTLNSYSGQATFKAKCSDGFRNFNVELTEDRGALVPRDQWIVKFDEEFTRIITLHVKLLDNSPNRVDFEL